MSTLFYARPASGGLPVFATLTALVLATLLLYRETATSIVTIWSRSDTFMHGFLVPPIVLWLIWQRRAEMLAQPMRAAPWFLLPVAAAGALWLLGHLGAADSVSHFMFVLMIVLLVPAVVGVRAAGAILFPLGFLFFAVPIGDFVMPWLRAGTADFTVSALRLTGIPVYREGTQFVIPSGAWSVVEACSGVRYLIASLMVGTLFAYLNYRTLWRRWVFVGVSLVVPIVANWLRAYFIVLLGHYSGNQIAVGTDHLIYGWFFFGIVIVVMFSIGARWSEPQVEPIAAAPRPEGGSTTRIPWLLAVSTAAVLALPALSLHALVSREDATLPLLAEPNLPAQRWAVSSAAPQWTPAFQGPAAQVQRTYVGVDGPVSLYVGYYRGQRIGSKLVSSSNELVRSSDEAWIQVGTGSRRVTLSDGSNLNVRTARLRRPAGAGDSTTLVVWQVYWVNGTFTSSDALAKAYGAVFRLLGRGDDGAVVIVHAAEDRPGSVDALLENFLRDGLGATEAQLRRTRDGD